MLPSGFMPLERLQLKAFRNGQLPTVFNRLESTFGKVWHFSGFDPGEVWLFERWGRFPLTIVCMQIEL
jgi:hypothetical protein